MAGGRDRCLELARETGSDDRWLLERAGAGRRRRRRVEFPRRAWVD